MSLHNIKICIFVVAIVNFFSKKTQKAFYLDALIEEDEIINIKV